VEVGATVLVELNANALLTVPVGLEVGSQQPALPREGGLGSPEGDGERLVPVLVVDVVRVGAHLQELRRAHVRDERSAGGDEDAVLGPDVLGCCTAGAAPEQCVRRTASSAARVLPAVGTVTAFEGELAIHDLLGALDSCVVILREAVTATAASATHLLQISS